MPALGIDARAALDAVLMILLSACCLHSVTSIAKPRLDRVARVGHLDMRAQAEVPRARRTDTPPARLPYDLLLYRRFAAVRPPEEGG